MKCSFGGCGSYAINRYQHGRDGSDGHLCDVCYWRSRAGIALEALERLRNAEKAPREEWDAALLNADSAIAKAKGVAL